MMSMKLLLLCSSTGIDHSIISPLMIDHFYKEISFKILTANFQMQFLLKFHP